MSFDLFLSIVISVNVIGASWLIGNKLKIGWAIQVLNQILWVVLIIRTQTWGLLLSSGVFGVVAFRNWIRWRREEAGLSVI